MLFSFAKNPPIFFVKEILDKDYMNFCITVWLT